jgi:hypothetical protein
MPVDIQDAGNVVYLLSEDGETGIIVIALPHEESVDAIKKHLDNGFRLVGKVEYNQARTKLEFPQ